MAERLPVSARASRLLGPRDLVFEDEPFDPSALGPDEISVATEFSAISPGTELAAYAGEPPLRPGPVYPRLVGYCNCGRVLMTGHAVTEVRAGDRVVTFASHRSHYRMPANEIAGVVPAGLGSAAASVAYLFHLALVSLQRAGLQPGQRVAVVGLGALGMATLAVAKAGGASVTAISGRDAALERARRLGADRTSSNDDRAAGDVRADIVVSTSNRWDDWRLAMQAAGRGGVIAVLGFPGRGQTPPDFNPLDSQYFYDKQLHIMATGQLLEPDGAATAILRKNMTDLMGWMVDGTLPAEEFSRHVVPWGGLARAYDDLLTRRDDALTFVLKW